ncbi:MAG: SRPBCC domain-containing protein [Pseudomonadota bacterium]|nr:SRPBCC domain-containing protein [Pseudomonadota bacterium]
MTDLSIEKPFPLPPDRVFDLVTAPAHLPSWWGPEGITLGEYKLDFTRPGPWFSVMIEPESAAHRVSGEVLHVAPDEAVELSWAWHDRETGRRGHESTVRLSVWTDGYGGTILSMRQTGLADAESARLHHEGWASSLARIGPLCWPD